MNLPGRAPEIEERKKRRKFKLTQQIIKTHRFVAEVINGLTNVSHHGENFSSSDGTSYQLNSSRAILASNNSNSGISRNTTKG